jgi:glucose-6-phosphate 1-dehydrogenase
MDIHDSHVTGEKEAVSVKNVTVLETGTCDLETPSDPCAIVVIGATGDLARRKLLRALYRLFKNGGLPADFFIVGADLPDKTSREYRDLIKESLRELGGEVLSERDWTDFASRIHYRTIDTETESPYTPVADFLSDAFKKRDMPANRLFYLAVPPSRYVDIIDGLGRASLAAEHDEFNGWSRVVIEKPFGHDLAGAQQLNESIHQHFREDQIFRIDHYLAKETVQNILMFRFANAIFEPVWNRNYIDHVQIMAAETLGVEHRAAYYEHAGVLRDMFQNHMLQLLAMTAMEPPSLFEADRVRDERIKVFRSLRPFPVDQLEDHLILGQYAAGKGPQGEVPAYRDEPDVDDDSLTPTFAMAKVFVDNWRWHGVPFYVCSGKRMAEKITEIIIQFKEIPYLMFRKVLPESIQPNLLAIRIQPNERISMTFQAKSPGAKICLQTVTMDFHYASIHEGDLLDAYETVILDCLIGDHTLFVRQEGVELCWAFLSPILDACESCDNRRKALHPYKAGTWGPSKVDELMNRDGRTWYAARSR